MRQKTRIPSNRMPADVPQRLGVLGCVLPAAMGAGLLVLFTDHSMVVIAVIAIIAAVSCVLTEIENRRQARIAAERLSESICTFARSFNCLETDTWIIRAVHVELQQYVKFPIRSDDRLEEDLHIDSDDIADVAEVIAQRTGRPIEECEQNPLYGKVGTVEELVEFFVHQPRCRGVIA